MTIDELIAEGKVLAGQRKHQEAIGKFSAALAQSRLGDAASSVASISALNSRGISYTMLGVTGKDPHSADFAAGLGDFLMAEDLSALTASRLGNSGEYSTAVKYRILAAEARHNIADNYRRQGHRDLALEAIEKGLDHLYDKTEMSERTVEGFNFMVSRLYKQKGLVYLQKEDNDKAIAPLENSLALLEDLSAKTPEDKTVKEALGNVKELLGTALKNSDNPSYLPKAFQLQTEAIALANQGGDMQKQYNAYITRGETQIKMGQYESALVDIAQAEIFSDTTARNQVPLYLDSAHAYLALGKIQEGIDYLSSFLGAFPQLLENDKQTKKKTFETVLKLCPDNLGLDGLAEAKTFYGI